ncbi:MAG: hypothetical protein RLZZ584_2441 [Pseudomonadota bacterium]|jgi:hypothetical protein
MTPGHPPSPPRLRRHRAAAALLPFLLLGVALAGCGGGIVITLGNDGYGSDKPPEVSLVADVTAARAGTPVHLSAAASDDHAVVAVEFFRIDPDNVTTALGQDRSPPWRWDTTMPDATAYGGDSVRYHARAVDDAGQARDSGSVVVLQLR